MATFFLAILSLFPTILNIFFLRIDITVRYKLELCEEKVRTARHKLTNKKGNCNLLISPPFCTDEDINIVTKMFFFTV